MNTCPQATLSAPGNVSAPSMGRPSSREPHCSTHPPKPRRPPLWRAAPLSQIKALTLIPEWAASCPNRAKPENASEKAALVDDLATAMGRLKVAAESGNLLSVASEAPAATEAIEGLRAEGLNCKGVPLP